MSSIVIEPKYRHFKAELIIGATYSPVYDFPTLSKTNFKPNKAVPFDKIKGADFNQWVHFYIHDDRFNQIWNAPTRYLKMLKKFAGVITPDFSVYIKMPRAMQIWNTYRNRATAYYLQKNGIPIIPNIRWGDERTYDFAFEGIAKGGTVAISTNGCILNKLDRYYFKKGLAKMVEVLHPSIVVNYSYTPDDIFKQYKDMGIEIIMMENYNLTREQQNKLPMQLTFFGGGGSDDMRGGFHSPKHLGRRQVGNTPMSNRSQNSQTASIAKKLKLTDDEASELHDLVHGMGWGYSRILKEAKLYFNIK
ncbi:MAG: DUF4417 domain-containing protein [Turicibacter sp.]|nr:DUF4417 domain-containing protein [Turicibacter sp.]